MRASLAVQAQASPLYRPLLKKALMFFSQNTHMPRKACLGSLHLGVQRHFSYAHGRTFLQALVQERKTLVLCNTQELLQAVLRACLAIPSQRAALQWGGPLAVELLITSSC